MLRYIYISINDDLYADTSYHCHSAYAGMTKEGYMKVKRETVIGYYNINEVEDIVEILRKTLNFDVEYIAKKFIEWGTEEKVLHEALTDFADELSMLQKKYEDIIKKY